MQRAQFGDRARIRYWRLSAPVDDEKEHARPKIIEFIVGSHEVPARVSRGIVGMALGDHRFFKIRMGEDGCLGESAIRRIRRNRLGLHRSLQVGERLRFVKRNTGHRLDMTVIRLTPDWVLLARNDQPECNVEVDVSLVSLDSSAATDKKSPIRRWRAGLTSITGIVSVLLVVDNGLSTPPPADTPLPQVSVQPCVRRSSDIPG